METVIKGDGEMPRRPIRSVAAAHDDTWPPFHAGRCHPSIDSTGRYTEHVPKFPVTNHDPEDPHVPRCECGRRRRWGSNAAQNDRYLLLRSPASVQDASPTLSPTGSPATPPRRFPRLRLVSSDGFQFHGSPCRSWLLAIASDASSRGKSINHEFSS